jgi:hypothetical protein
VESLEKKRVEFLMSAKSAKECGDEGRGAEPAGGTPSHQYGPFSKQRSSGKSVL